MVPEEYSEVKMELGNVSAFLVELRARPGLSNIRLNTCRRFVHLTATFPSFYRHQRTANVKVASRESVKVA